MRGFMMVLLDAPARAPKAEWVLNPDIGAGGAELIARRGVGRDALESPARPRILRAVTPQGPAADHVSFTHHSGS